MTYLLIFLIAGTAATCFLAGNRVKQKKQNDEARRRRIVENLRVALSD